MRGVGAHERTWAERRRVLGQGARAARGGRRHNLGAGHRRNPGLGPVWGWGQMQPGANAGATWGLGSSAT